MASILLNHQCQQDTSFSPTYMCINPYDWEALVLFSIPKILFFYHSLTLTLYITSRKWWAFSKDQSFMTFGKWMSTIPSQFSPQTSSIKASLAAANLKRKGNTVYSRSSLQHLYKQNLILLPPAYFRGDFSCNISPIFLLIFYIPTL